MPNCPSCGAPQVPGAAFCGQCGKPLSQQAPTPPPQPAAGAPAGTPPYPAPPPGAAPAQPGIPSYPAAPAGMSPAQGQRPAGAPVYPAPAAPPVQGPPPGVQSYPAAPSAPGVPPYQAPSSPGVPPFQAPPHGAPYGQGQPPFGQSYPYAQGTRKKKFPIGLVIAIPIFLLVIGAGIYFLSDFSSPANPVASLGGGGGQWLEPADPMPILFEGGTGFQWDSVAAYGHMLMVSENREIIMYEVNDGGPMPLNAYSQSNSGDVLDIAIGEAYNNGSLMAFVSFENGLLVIVESGESQWIEAKPYWVRIGDFDGDGLREVIFAEQDESGQPLLTMWRYTDEDSQMLAQVSGTDIPFVYPTPLWDEQDKLIGFEQGVVQIYDWDDTFGLIVVEEFSVNDRDPVVWLTGDTDGTVGISRGGSEPYMEWYESDGSTFSQMGAQYLPGSGNHALFTGAFDEDGWLFAIDKSGHYFVH